MLQNKETPRYHISKRRIRVYILAISREGEIFLYKLKNREEFEGRLNKSPQKQGRIFRGGGEDFVSCPEYIPLRRMENSSRS